MRLPQGRIVAAVIACTFFAFAGVALAQSDPSVGTWKLNLTKSKYSPGPLPKSNTVTIAAVPNWTGYGRAAAPFWAPISPSWAAR